MSLLLYFAGVRVMARNRRAPIMMNWRLGVGVLLVLVVVVAGCGRDNELPTLSLEDLQPITEGGRNGTEGELRVALASITSPDESLEYYSELLKYLE